MNIFLSYGHDKFDKFALRLKQDLEKTGFQVWMDVDGIRGSSDWEIEIENGISVSDWFVIIMTRHSCRRPDGVCLDEVSYARFLGKKIAPIMMENVRPPLCIARIQYIDMENHFDPEKEQFDEDAYQKQFQTLLAVLSGAAHYGREGEYETLRSRLMPLDNDVYYEHFRQNFFGREKLFRYYREWVSGPSPLLWLTGNAGVGKTAFIAKLAEDHEEIKAVHFCRYNDSDRANPKRAIMSLAYYLATQNEEYKRLLLELRDLDALHEKSTDRLFSYLLIEPLSRIRNPEGMTVIVIDALDEAMQDGNNELADILASRHKLLPKWVKIIITSREDPVLRRKLSGIRPVSFEDEAFADNSSDIHGYLEMRLQSLQIPGLDAVIRTLQEKSAGNFLYAKTVTEDILSGTLELRDDTCFPDGLAGIYAGYFDRMLQSGECDFRNDIRPLLEILCAEYSPIPTADIIDILDVDEYDFDIVKDSIAQMFPEKNGIIEPIHKSIADWLTDRDKAGRYRVSPARGHQRLAQYCTRRAKRRAVSDYVLKYAVKHLIRADDYDQAVSFLNDQSFQDRRIRMLGLDTALRSYLNEIGALAAAGEDVEETVYTGSLFTHYFAEHRKFLYNTGLYFTLKENRFDQAALSDALQASTELKAGIASYFYITERFGKAMEIGREILEHETDPGIIVEMSNLVGLSLRKFALFDEAGHYFRKAVESARTPSDDYEKSGAYMNLAKLYYHELNWEKAIECNEAGIDLLQKVQERTDDEDTRLRITLFLAEYYRLAAECLLWMPDIAGARNYLEKAGSIYHEVVTRDRYYVRFLYTSAMASLFAGRADEGLSLCEKAEESASSRYDKAQILFCRALALLQNGRRDEAADCAARALETARSIGALMETEEISLLLGIAEGSPDPAHSGHCDNPCIKTWAGHVFRLWKEMNL